MSSALDKLVLEIRNYRSFSNTPARLEFYAGGFTGIVGTNNAGKSTLLRLFWELRPLFARTASYLQHSNSGFERWLGGTSEAGFKPQMLSGERVFPAVGNGDPEIRIEFGPSPYGESDDIWPVAATLILARDYSVSMRVEMRDGDLVYHEARRVSNVREGSSAATFHVRDRYVDMTRLGEVADLLSNTMYVGPFRNAIHVGAGSYFDIAIGDAFIAEFAEMKSGPNATTNEAVARMTEELRQIFKFRSLEINAAADRKSLQLMVDGISYRGSEMGSGLSHFALVVASILTKRPSLLLIDEPELNLHPALQIDFLLLLGSLAGFSVGFATHSLGLARSVADKLYAVTRSDRGASDCQEFHSTPDLAALVGQLGYSGAKDVQFDGLLLVEGITDVRTFVQLLRLYGKEHRYAIVPLGGTGYFKEGVGVELSQLRRLSDRVVAIIDSERTEQGGRVTPGRLAFQRECSKMRAMCHILDRRSIESYFPEEAVRRVYGPRARALGPFEPPQEAGFSWAKVKNWKVAREIRVSELEGTDLATILSDL